MGVPWHKQSEKSGREWVIYAAAGLVLLVVAGGITAGVIIGGKSSSDSTSSQGSASPPAIPTAAQPTSSSLPASSTSGEVHEASTVELSPPPAPFLASGPVPSPPAATLPPPPVPAAAAGFDPPPPPTQPPTAASPAPAAANTTTPAATSGYDPTFIAPGTTNGAPPAPGFVQDVAEGKKGTCEMQGSREWYCNDDMTGASGPDISNLTLMHDAEQMESCGYADMTAIVNSLVKWAYKGDCGVAAFTVARACIGKPGVADGYWRARVQLWPNAASTAEICQPLCIKLRGFQNQVTEYGRTGSCNRARE